MHIENTEVYLSNKDYYEILILLHFLSYLYFTDLFEIEYSPFMEMPFYILQNVYAVLANHKDALDYITNERKSTETKKVFLIEPR